MAGYYGYVRVEMKPSRWQMDAKTFRALAKEAWQDTGEYWHEKILPKHFTAAGAQEYRYKPRSQRYNERKQKKHGHQIPLVWSGAMRDTVTKWADISGTSKGAKVKLPSVKYFFAYKPGQPNKADEVVRLSYGDQRALAKFWDQNMQARIQLKEKGGAGAPGMAMGGANLGTPAAA